MYLKTQGLVLRQTNYKEADKILTVLTKEHGKMTLKASACRRKNSKLMSIAQLLVYSDMTLLERQDRFSLKEGLTIEQFLGLRHDVVNLSLASYFAEVVEAVAQEGLPQPELLSLILNALYALDYLKKPSVQVKAAFEVSLMCLLGYEPQLQQCSICHNERPVDPCLHLREGEVHCAKCREKMGEGISMPLTEEALKAMQFIAWGDSKKLFSFRLNDYDMEKLANVSEAFLMTQLERGFRTLDFYKQMTLISTEI